MILIVGALCSALAFVSLHTVSHHFAKSLHDSNDPNDLDDVAFAQMTFEDIYICILKTDGIRRAAKLRDKVNELAKRPVVKQAGIY
jgi:hypothetical protein